MDEAGGVIDQGVSEQYGQAGESATGHRVQGGTEAQGDPLAGIKPRDEQAARILNGWKMRKAGKLTHLELKAGLSKLFEPEMMDLLSAWIKGHLFVSQNFKNLDQFLAIDERDWKHDFARWNEFYGVADLTGQRQTEDYAEVAKFAKKWVVPPLEYRRQFLDQQGNPMRHFDEKEISKEFERLKERFF